MDIKITFHLLAIICIILAVVFGATFSNNKIVLIVITLIFAGIFELAIPFLNNSSLPFSSETPKIPFQNITFNRKERDNLRSYMIRLNNKFAEDVDMPVRKAINHRPAKVEKSIRGFKECEGLLRKFAGK